jgi:enoyl-CoA hydratase/carnithine racemase
MISLSVYERIATLTLSRPPVNAISTEWSRLFDARLDELAAHPDWAVLHLRSDQKVFCAGADLDEIQSYIGSPDGPDRMYVYIAGLQRLFTRIEALPQVTLAEIAGAALGGGLELALACDLRVAANEAKLGLPEVQLGLIPSLGGTQRLTRLVGRAMASRLILGAEVIDGATANALGVVQWAVPRTQIAGHAAETAKRIAALPPAALAAAKSCIAAAGAPGRDGNVEELEQVRRLLSEPETRARIGAFLAGRQP